MQLTAYTYPWDVARLGATRVVDDLVARGFDAVDLAATYHPIDALSPRGGFRLFTSPRGAVHFPARPERYDRIRPQVVPDPDVPKAWRQLAEAARRRGLTLNAWIVVLFQPWIVDAYPDCARVLPSGEPIGSGLCPAAPDVQQYVAALVGDLHDQFGIGTVRLEGIMFPEFDYGWLRPRILVDLSPETRELLALCFCASCRGRAMTEGIDVERVRAVVTNALTRLDDRATEPAEVVAGLQGDAELLGFLRQHHSAAVDLARAVAAATGRTGPRLTDRIEFGVTPLATAERTEATVDLLDALDGVMVLPRVRPDQLDTIRTLAARVRHPLRLQALVAPFGLHALVASDRAAVSDRAAPSSTDLLLDELRTACAVPVDEVSLYNYGLLRDRDLDRFGAAVVAVFS